ncbi:MAG: hypothetical protein DI588_00220 [Flavobacterium johnsoniae]|nr:MAG: hypothetical protein DI588_00220 [Flavobacterium johnsoniae]
MGIFKDYVNKLENCTIQPLPVNHIANIKSIEEFFSKNKISNDYLVDKCEVFNEHYLYIFYGRAAFRLNKPDAYPICFVFKKPDLDPVKVFPFDSGAFYHKRMAEYFNIELTLDDFDFGGNNDYIYRIVKHFFEDNTGYYDEKTKSISVEEDIPAIKGYLNMIAAENNDRLDGRKSAIELIYDFPFDLNKGLELVIIPELDLKISTGKMSFEDIKAKLETSYNCQVTSYPNKMIDPIDSSYKDIKKIVRSYIKNNGGL